jgi:hypothetical protein
MNYETGIFWYYPAVIWLVSPDFQSNKNNFIKLFISYMESNMGKSQPKAPTQFLFI